jgi:hypothetical protein
LEESRRQRAIEKVKKLLRLSKSSNEHEAALAAAKAQEFLSAYNLTEVDCREEEPKQKAGMAATATVKNPAEWIVVLAASVAKAFDCQSLHSTCGYTLFVGAGLDFHVANCTFAFLYRKVNGLAARYMNAPHKKGMGRGRRSKTRRSYCLGLVEVIAGKLAQQSAETPLTSAALVSAKRALIARTVEALNISREERELKISNGRAYRAGLRDGESVDCERREDSR